MIYNTLGQQVRQFDYDQTAPGTLPVTVEADGLAAGVYYYMVQVETGDGEHRERSGRMVLAR